MWICFFPQDIRCPSWVDQVQLVVSVDSLLTCFSALFFPCSFKKQTWGSILNFLFIISIKVTLYLTASQTRN